MKKASDNKSSQLVLIWNNHVLIFAAFFALDFYHKKNKRKNNYLRCYRSELVVTEKINLSLVWITAEMQGLISINSKAQNTKEKHSN